MAIRVCLIGCGRHARSVHGPSYLRYQKEYQNVEFVACCDVSQESAASFATTYGFAKYYTDYHEMLATEKPDAVVVIVPPAVSCNVASDVMRAGCAILMEKPIGNTLEECAQLIATAEETKVINQVAFNRRHIPLLKTMMERIAESGQKIQHINCEMYRYQRTGRFHHTMVHAIDAVKYIAQSTYKSANVQYQALPHVVAEETANIYMDAQFENGVYAHIQTLPSTGVAVERFVVALDEDCYFLNSHAPMPTCYDAPGELVVLKKGVEVERIRETGDIMCVCSGFYAQVVDFFAHVIAGEPSVHSLASGLQAMELSQVVQDRGTAYTGK